MHLRKVTEIEIKADSPFANDALKRQQPVELLTKLIQSTSQPFVLSVEAPWGFGKTTFVNLWKTHLESQKHVCFYFNAWQNDFVDDPLVAFLGEMRKFVETEFGKLNEDDPIKKDWEDVKRIGGGILRKTLPLAIQVATHGIFSKESVKEIAESLSAEKIGEFAADLAKERLEKYALEKESISNFRTSLEKLASKIGEKKDKKLPLVFFVDELDRCRPDFAVALLERIKHLFNVNNIVFILAIDRAQLNESVKALYGLGMNPDGYLRRFIDLAYQLEEPSPDSFALSLYNRFSFQEHMENGRHLEIFLGSFAEYAHVFGLSLRAQAQCFTSINIALRTNPMIRNYPSALAFLATLRAFRSNVFQDIQSNQIQINSVLSWISSVKRDDRKICAEATLLVLFPEKKDAANRLHEINRLTATGPINPNEMDQSNRAEAIKREMEKLSNWHPNAVEHLVALLSLSTQFGS